MNIFSYSHALPICTTSSADNLNMSAEWQRFQEVTRYMPSGHRLYRASTPNYSGHDSSQCLTDTAVQFLADQGIDSIISLNEHPYTTTEMNRLNNANIAYHHIGVADFQAPTIAQLGSANRFFREHQATLVHCGYGHGRTGTAVTALQLYATRGRYPGEG